MKGQTGQRLDPFMENYIDEMADNIPVVKASLNTFVSLALQCPPTIAIPALNIEASDELTLLLQTKWMDWLRSMYRWLTLYGIFPYYTVKIRNTDHRYPVSPPREAGYIETALGKHNLQEYKWIWTQGNEKIKVRFITKNSPPSLNGAFKTPIVALAPDYRTLKIARAANEEAWVMQTIPQHVIEYHPSTETIKTDKELINAGNSNALAQGQGLAEASRGSNFGANNDAQMVRVKDARAQFEKARMQNLANRGTPIQKKKREALFGNTVHLGAGFKHVNIAPVKVDVNIKQISEMIDEKASTVVDFPAKIMFASQRTTSAANNSLRFINERVKDWIQFFETSVRDVLVEIYGQELQEELDALGAYKNIAEEIVVELPCTPLINFDELYKYYETGLMSKETLAKHTFNNAALPESEIELSDRQPEKRKRKTQATLEEEPKEEKEDKPEKRKKRKKEKEQE